MSVSVCGFNASDNTNALCPACHKPGKKISPQTLKSLVKGDRVPVELNGYSLCLSSDCDVVYFGEQVFGKEDVKVKVWFKEPESATVPICYCRNVTNRDIYDHIAVRNCCSNIEDIQEHTGANKGKDCLTKNPAGT